MTENELIRWTRLVVAQARGCSLTPAARAERRQFEREQPELAGEASLWAEFAELEQPRPREQDDDAMIAAVLSRAAVREEPAPEPNPEPNRPRRTVRGAATLLLALAACVLLGLVLERLRGLGSEAIDQGANEPLGGAAMVVEPHTELRVATPGEHRLARGDCRRTSTGATLCTRDRVQFRIDARSSPHRIALELEDGQLQIDATTDDTPVEVSTPAGVIRTHGIVDLRFDPSTDKLDIDVIAGEAELVRSQVAPLRLDAGATLSLLAGTVPPRMPSQGDPDHSASDHLDHPDHPHPGHLDAAAEPVAPAKPSVVKPAPPTADELLAAAQRALADGASTMAIERYQVLIAEYPESGAANIGSVSLGRLLLRQGRGSQALAAFDRYLESGALELIEVARHGRIVALRELGRTAEADEAIAAFLLAHPGSIHRERLEAWRNP
jgi:hypothetical protein